MVAVQLVLVYAVLMSVWWIVMKLLMRLRVVENEPVVFPNNLIRFASGCGALLLVGWSLARHGGVRYIASLPTGFWMWLSATVALNVVIAYCYVKAMQKSVASIAVHVTLLAPAVAIFTGYAFGVDRIPSPVSIAGIFSILAGLYILHFSPRKYGLNLAGPIVDIWCERGRWLWYALGIAAAAGCSIPIDKQCVLLSDYGLAPGLTLFLAWGVFYGVAAWRAGDFRHLRRFPALPVFAGLVTIGVVFGISNGFQAEAYNYQYASAVASLKRLDAPFTVLWAFLLLRQEERAEGHFAFRIAGSLTAFTGAVLIGIDKAY